MKSKLSVVVLLLAVAGCASESRQQALVAPPLAGEPADVAGLAPANVRAAFGAPSFVRKDGTTQMWRYDSPMCRAFFFFYDQSGVQSVRHVETLPRGVSMAADANCLDALRARAKVS